MPVLPPAQQNTQPYVSAITSPCPLPPPNQLYSFRQLVGRLLQYNPDLPVTVAQALIRESYRRIIDHRSWYGLMVKGSVMVPDAYTQGTVTVTTGSPTVTGNNTNWTPDMIGRQFRIGFQTPIYTIVDVPNATTLTLDLPWQGKNFSGVGYLIFKNIVSFGDRIRQLLAVVNQTQGYRLRLDIPQEVLNLYDTWRQTTGWTFLVASAPPDPCGTPQWELYPAPTVQQSFPFIAYIQPPDLVNDNDYPWTFIRGDVILYGALPQALTFRGPRENKYYDMQAAAYYQSLFQQELEKMAAVDDQLYPKDLMWDFARYPFTSLGATFWQSHDPDQFITIGYGGSWTGW
jgi:hypothetical protein